MSSYYILDDDNDVVQVEDLHEWGTWMENIENRRVALTYVSPHVHVSTVFLGLDHDFMNHDGPPLIFESMVFGGEHDQEMVRYRTWEEAERGHAYLIARVKESLTWWSRLKSWIRSLNK